MELNAVTFEVGQTVIYDDPGVPFYYPRSERAGKIIAVEPSRHHGCYLVVEVAGINLPKRIIPTQVIGFTATELMETAAA